MTSQPIRDQVEDHLITPKNSAPLIIDYQPPQVSSIVSMDHLTLVANIVAVAKLAKLYGVPIVLSIVNVKSGLNTPTIRQLAEMLAGFNAFDRTLFPCGAMSLKHAGVSVEPPDRGCCSLPRRLPAPAATRAGLG